MLMSAQRVRMSVSGQEWMTETKQAQILDNPSYENDI